MFLRYRGLFSNPTAVACGLRPHLQIRPSPKSPPREGTSVAALRIYNVIALSGPVFKSDGHCFITAQFAAAPSRRTELAFGSRTPAAVGEQHAVEPQQPYPPPQSPDGNARGLKFETKLLIFKRTTNKTVVFFARSVTNRYFPAPRGSRRGAILSKRPSRGGVVGPWAG